MHRTIVALVWLALASSCSSSDKDNAGGTVSLPKKKPSASATASATATIEAPGSATASIAPMASAPNGPRSGWPLPPVACVMEGKVKGCTTPEHEPGVQCGDEKCFNPCPVGMAPDAGGSFCNKICKADAECGAGGKCDKGTCDTTPKLSCEGGAICSLGGGDMGVECEGKCVNPCKRGLNLYGGTHCAKHCKDPSECPGGECADGFCIPLCPAEGCPYPWE